MKSLVSVCAVALSVVPPLAAQDLNVSTIWGGSDFVSRVATVQWIDTETYTVTESDGALVDLYRVDAVTGNRLLVVSGQDLVPPGADAPIRIESYEYSDDRSKILIFTNSVRVWRQNTKGEYFVWLARERRLQPISTEPGLQMFAKFSPDGSRVGFVRDNDLFVTDLATGRERRLTRDGGDDIINGTADWVYEEELGLRDAFRFSPDGSRVAFWRFDQSAVKPFFLIDEIPLYPTVQPIRYPKAGEKNSTVRIGVIEVEGPDDVRWIDLGDLGEGYVPRMEFTADPDRLWFTRLNRHQNRLDLLLADVRTGASRVIMTDTDEAWVDSRAPFWLADGGFLTMSDRDGFTHIYRFRADGSVAGQLTSGSWDVSQIYGVDAERDLVYFLATAEGPLERHVYRVGLDGTGWTRITREPGSHAARFDPSMTRFLDTHSTAATPPVQTVRQADGTAIRTLDANDALATRIDRLELIPPEFLTVPVDGATLNAYVIKPPNFDPSRRYPLLMYVYGGPGSQTVTNRWGGQRYLWHQMLARQGYLVASVDNRGTGARGRAFKKITYLRLGEMESRDQIAAARYFGTLPFIDGDRIGIWGWSYGGYMASLSMLRGGGVFRAALAVAPVTDWRLYDTIYTERFMRTPQENPEGYRAGAPVTYADRLTGSLLLVHGTGDDNVHPQQTTRLVDALIAANIQFDMQLYPNRTHSIAGGVSRVHLYTLFTDWLRENLYEAPAVVIP